MKKALCIILACFMLASVPLHGYAVAPTTFGIGVEVILPFLLSLLGIQAKNEITSYEDLEVYHDEVYNELVDGLAGMAGTNVIQNWLIRAASGIIDTDSVIWQKIREIAISNYVESSNDQAINNNVFVNGVDLSSLHFAYRYSTSYSNATYTYISEGNYCYRQGANNFIYASDNNDFVYRRYTIRKSDGVIISDDYYGGLSKYTYNGKTVYYRNYNLNGAVGRFELPVYNGTNPGIACWYMVYGDYSLPSENIASVSDAFSDVLASADKDDIIDGTSVIQLYNPSALQNGLEIIPGGDPNDDPNLRKIPFAITADWWNLLQQFGDDAVNQSVAAYNALNNADDGTSTGRISRAWDALGIGSVVGSAQNAEEGIIDLTDENIYPRSSTVQQTVTDSIPSSLTPEAPDNGLDNESEQGLYKLPDLRDYFPFCIPFDLIDLLQRFVAEPETPQFAIALSTGFSTSTEEVNLDVVDSIASIVRTFELIGFVLALILITRNIIRG